MTGNDLLDKVLPRLSKLPDTSGVSILDAINRTIEIFFDRLHQRKSDIVREQLSNVTVDSEFTYLPKDFRGFSGPVRLEDEDGEFLDLTEMPYGEEKLEYANPVYWRLVGPFKLQIIPAAEEDYTLDGFYFSMPNPIESLDEDLPWEGLLDRKFEDAVVVIASVGGPQGVTEEVEMGIGDMCERKISNRTYHPRSNKLWL